MIWFLQIAQLSTTISTTVSTEQMGGMNERYPMPTTQQHSTKTQSIVKKIYYTFLTSNLGLALLVVDVVAAGWSTSIGVDMTMMMREYK
jgi:hypothetical protein